MQKTEIKGHSRKAKPTTKDQQSRHETHLMSLFSRRSRVSIASKTKEPTLNMIHFPPCSLSLLEYLLLSSILTSLAFRLTAIAFLSICKWYIAAAKARLQAELPKESPIMVDHSSSLLQFPAILQNWFFLNRLHQIKLENYISKEETINVILFRHKTHMEYTTS